MADKKELSKSIAEELALFDAHAKEVAKAHSAFASEIKTYAEKVSNDLERLKKLQRTNEVSVPIEPYFEILRQLPESDVRHFLDGIIELSRRVSPQEDRMFIDQVIAAKNENGEFVALVLFNDDRSELNKIRSKMSFVMTFIYGEEPRSAAKIMPHYNTTLQNRFNDELGNEDELAVVGALLVATNMAIQLELQENQMRAAHSI